MLDSLLNTQDSPNKSIILFGYASSERPQELLALPVPRSLLAISSMPARSTLCERLPDLDFFADDPPPLPNLLRYRENFRA